MIKVESSELVSLGHNITKNKNKISSLMKNCGVKNGDVPGLMLLLLDLSFVSALLLSVKEKMQIIMAGEKVGEIRYC